MNEVTVRAPATVSNVVCGFDCLGFALSEPADEFVVKLIDRPEIVIVHEDDFGLPTDPAADVSGVALRALMRAARDDVGFEITSRKTIKPGSGVGSSAASACGAVVGANALLGERFSRQQLFEFAMAGERAASGSAHADNVAPCLLGGFSLVRSLDPLDVVSLAHPELFAVVLHPQIEIKTSEARAMLPERVALTAAVRQWSNLGAFVAALASGDRELMQRSMVDEIIEPVRKALIPRFDDVMAAARNAGAIGGGISGSGPSVFALAGSAAEAADIERAYAEVYGQTEIDHRIYVSGIDRDGAKIV